MAVAAKKKTTRKKATRKAAKKTVARSLKPVVPEITSDNAYEELTIAKAQREWLKAEAAGGKLVSVEKVLLLMQGTGSRVRDRLMTSASRLLPQLWEVRDDHAKMMEVLEQYFQNEVAAEFQRWADMPDSLVDEVERAKLAESELR